MWWVIRADSLAVVWKEEGGKFECVLRMAEDPNRPVDGVALWFEDGLPMLAVGRYRSDAKLFALENGSWVERTDTGFEDLRSPDRVVWDASRGVAVHLKARGGAPGAWDKSAWYESEVREFEGGKWVPKGPLPGPPGQDSSRFLVAGYDAVSERVLWISAHGLAWAWDGNQWTGSGSVPGLVSCRTHSAAGAHTVLETPDGKSGLLFPEASDLKGRTCDRSRIYQNSAHPRSKPGRWLTPGNRGAWGPLPGPKPYTWEGAVRVDGKTRLLGVQREKGAPLRVWATLGPTGLDYDGPVAPHVHPGSAAWVKGRMWVQGNGQSLGQIYAIDEEGVDFVGLGSWSFFVRTPWGLRVVRGDGEVLDDQLATLTPAGGVPPRTWFAIAYHDGLDAIVLTSGADPNHKSAKGTWTWRPSEGWAELKTKGRGPACSNARAAYHPGLDTFVVTGGAKMSFKKAPSTWELVGNKWTRHESPRAGTDSLVIVAFDPGTEQFLAVWQYGPDGRVLTTYDGGGVWRKVAELPPISEDPPERYSLVGAMAWDPNNRRLVLAGNSGDRTFTGGCWSLDVGPLIDRI